MAGNPGIFQISLGLEFFSSDEPFPDGLSSIRLDFSVSPSPQIFFFRFFILDRTAELGSAAPHVENNTLCSLAFLACP